MLAAKAGEDLQGKLTVTAIVAVMPRLKSMKPLPVNLSRSRKV
jgi:hypothetical protein